MDAYGKSIESEGEETENEHTKYKHQQMDNEIKKSLCPIGGKKLCSKFCSSLNDASRCCCCFCCRLNQFFCFGLA